MLRIQRHQAIRGFSLAKTAGLFQRKMKKLALWKNEEELNTEH